MKSQVWLCCTCVRSAFCKELLGELRRGSARGRVRVKDEVCESEFERAMVWDTLERVFGSD